MTGGILLEPSRFSSNAVCASNAEPIDSSARLLALFPKELLMLFNSIALTSSPLSSASKSQFLVGRNQPGNVHMRPWS